METFDPNRQNETDAEETRENRMMWRLEWALQKLSYKESFDEAYFFDDEDAQMHLSEYRINAKELRFEAKQLRESMKDLEPGSEYDDCKLKLYHIREEIKIVQALCRHLQNCQYLRKHSHDTFEMMKPEIYVSLHIKNLANATLNKTHERLWHRPEEISVIRDISCRYLGSKDAEEFIRNEVRQLKERICYCMDETSREIGMMSQVWLRQNMV